MTMMVVPDDNRNDSTAPAAAAKRRKRPRLRVHLSLSPQFHHKHCQQQQQTTFTHGDRVYYRPKGSSTTGNCGTFQQQHVADDEKKKKGKSWVQFDDEGQRRQVAASRLLPIYNVSREEIGLVVTDDTNRFRQLAISQIQGTRSVPCSTNESVATASSTSSATDSSNKETVLEIGCSTGETSAILWRQTPSISSWVGLDTSTNMVEAVQRKMNDDDDDGNMKLHCQRVDALVDPDAAIKAACTFSPNGPTVVFLDIGGNREEVGVWRMLQFLLQACPFPNLRQIIIKSRALAQSLLLPNSEKPPKTGSSPLDKGGIVVDSIDSWLEKQLGRLSTSVLRALPKHPQKAPLRYSPPDDDGKTIPICRYYNYHTDGCQKKDECPLDHVHCHVCLQPGHIARMCAQVQQHE